MSYRYNPFTSTLDFYKDDITSVIYFDGGSSTTLYWDYTYNCKTATDVEADIIIGGSGA